MPSFEELSLQSTTLATLTHMQITEPTPIQEQAIPTLLAGKDMVGQSATGSGKTLAYGLPLVERLARNQRVTQALILVPTRELAVQVNTVLSKFAANRKLTTALLVGGRSYAPQMAALRHGAQIVIGTPGRVQDHLDRGSLVLTELRICVLDEADQMLDSGFAPAIEAILTTTPETRQMALFSATMPEWVAKLEEKFLKDPVHVNITSVDAGESTIEQIAYQVSQAQKMAALCTLLNSAEGESTLIFGKTKFGVEKLGKQLSKLGFAVETLHGNKSQSAREKVLMAFRKGQVQTLLATNVAARGLDIQGIAQVINYELPESSELFTHRIGRTGRMGRQGKAITLLVPSDVGKWKRMARSLGQEVKLQKLAIDEEAAVEPVTGPSVMLVDEQKSEPTNTPKQPLATYIDEKPRGGRNRKQSPVSQEMTPSQESRAVRRRKQFGEVKPEQHGVQSFDRKRRPSGFQGKQERREQLSESYVEEEERPKKRQPQDAFRTQNVRTPAFRSDSFSEPDRPSSGQGRSERGRDRRDAGFARPTGRRGDYGFATTGSTARMGRRKPVASGRVKRSSFSR